MAVYLTIGLVKGRDLPPMDENGKSDPYVMLSLGKAQEYKSHCKKKKLDPEWNQDFNFKAEADLSEEILLEVFDWDMFTANDLMGKVTIPLSMFKEQKTITDWFPLHDKDNNESQGALYLNMKLSSMALDSEVRDKLAAGEPTGAGKDKLESDLQTLYGDYTSLNEDHTKLRGTNSDLQVEFKQTGDDFERLQSRSDDLEAEIDTVSNVVRNFIVEEDVQTEAVSGTLHVDIAEGKDLPALDKDTSDPFITIDMARDQSYKSEVQKNTLRPRWHEKHDFTIEDSLDELTVIAYDFDAIGANDFMGQFKCSLRTFRNCQDSEIWFDLRDKEGKVAQGQILLKFTFDETPSGAPEDDEEKEQSQLLRDIKAAFKSYKVINKDFSSVNQSYEKLQNDNAQLDEEHGKLVSEHATLEEKHTKVTKVQEIVGDLVTGFIKENEITTEKVKGTLTVELQEGKELASMDSGGSSDPYVKLEMNDQNFKSEVQKSTINPTWNQTFTFDISDSLDELRLAIVDHDTIGSDNFMGSVRIPFQQFGDAEEVNDWFEVRDSDFKEPVEGFLKLKLTFQSELADDNKESEDAEAEAEAVSQLQKDVSAVHQSFKVLHNDHELLSDTHKKLSTEHEKLSGEHEQLCEEHTKLTEGHEKLTKDYESVGTIVHDFIVEKEIVTEKVSGILHVELLEAKDLEAMDFGNKSDPFVELSMEEQSFKSETQKGTLNPTWNQSFEFNVEDAMDDLVLEVVDWDLTSNDFMGKTTIPFRQFRDCSNSEEWFDLKNKDGQDVAPGQVRLRLTYEDKSPSPVDSEVKADSGAVEESEQTEADSGDAEAETGASKSQLERDVVSVAQSYRIIDKDLSIVTESHNKLKSEHEQLTNVHQKLTEDHTELTEVHNRITREQEGVAGIVKDFIIEQNITTEIVKGTLHLELMEGKELPAADGDTSDPYVTLALNDQQFKSKTVSKTLSPTWNEKYDFDVNNGLDEVVITIVDHDVLSKDDFMAKVVIPLRKFRDTKDGVEEWFECRDENHKEPVGGFIRLKLQFDDQSPAAEPDEPREEVSALEVKEVEEPAGAAVDVVAEEAPATEDGVTEVDATEASDEVTDATQEEPDQPPTSADVSQEQPPEEVSEEKQAPKPQLQRDVACIHQRHRIVKKDLEILTDDHQKLTQQHTQLQSEHTELTNEHNKLTKDYTNLKDDHAGVAKHVSEFVTEHDISTVLVAGNLKIELQEAKELISEDSGGTSDPYCVMKLGEQEFKSETIKSTLEPKWNEEHSFTIANRLDEVVIEVYDWDRFSGNDAIGFAKLPFRRFRDFHDKNEDWYPLFTADGEDAGEVFLKVTYADTSEESSSDDAKSNLTPLQFDTKCCLDQYVVLETEHKELIKESELLIKQMDELMEAHTALKEENQDLTDERDEIHQSKEQLEKELGEIRTVKEKMEKDHKVEVDDLRQQLQDEINRRLNEEREKHEEVLIEKEVAFEGEVNKWMELTNDAQNEKDTQKVEYDKQIVVLNKQIDSKKSCLLM